jgi:hypothetical protein
MGKAAHWCVAGILALGILGWGLPARADDAPKPAPSAAKGKARTIRLDEISVEGRIQKPQAFYILQRSNLNFGELERTETFLPKIVQSVNHDPF